jgi:acyl-CoA thioester hydrolase
MELVNFRHIITLVTRFADVDMMGHVNNAKYHTYLEEARLAYAAEVLRLPEGPNTQGMILARTVIDFLLPLPPGQKIEVHTRCSRLGRKSFDLSYMMISVPDEKLACTAVTTMVGYDYEQQSSIFVPDHWRERMVAYEIIPPEGH